MKKRIIAALLALAMVVTGLYVTKPEAEEVKAADTTSTSTEVSTEMLGIKMQPKVDDKDTEDTSDDTLDLRIVSSVDSLDYSEVGFYVWYADAAKAPTDTNRTAHFRTWTVLERISATSNVTYNFSPKVIDTCSEYFVTGTIAGIKYANWGEDFYIQAYCKTLDGALHTGVGRYFNVNDAIAPGTINIPVAMDEAPATDENGNITEDVKLAGSATTATLEKYIDGYAHVNVAVAGGDKTALASATKVEVGSASAIYRNLESKLSVSESDGTVTVTGDTTWYTAYENEDAFIIANAADLYGFAQADTNFSGKTIYMVADIDANDEKGTATADGFAREDGATPYPWSPIGGNTTDTETSIRNFAGTFDGQMHTVSGVYLSRTGTANGSWGLFGETGVCTVTNLTLANSYFGLINVTNNADLGSIAGKSNGVFDTIKVVDGVYLTHTNSASYEDYTGGIVGRMSGTVVTGSKISNCQFAGQITASDYVGGILACASDGSDATTVVTAHKKAVEIEYCLNSGKFVLNNTGNCIGGICGTVIYAQVVMDNSLNLASIDLNTSYSVHNLTTGSLFGWIRNNYLNAATTTDGTENTYSAIITNSYGISEGNWKSMGYKNGKGHTNFNGTPYPGSGSLTDSYLSASKLIGTDGYVNMNLDFSVADDFVGNWTVTNEFPVLSSFLNEEEVIDVREVTTARTAWYVAGMYTTTDTYTLYTKADMYGFASLSSVDFAEKTVKLGADITMNEGTVAEWETASYAGLTEWTVRNMAGTFDGDNHTLQGIYLDTDKGNAGLFGTVTGTVKNLRLQNSYFNCTDATANNYASTNYLYATGSIAGSLSGTLDTVYSDAIVKHTYAYAGGLVGTVYDATTDGTGESLITNSCFAGEITARNGVGGIVGLVVNTSATIEHCLNAGTITTTDLIAGGLCGYVWTNDSSTSHVLTLNDCLNVGRLVASATTWNGAGIGYVRGATASVTAIYHIRYYADEVNSWDRLFWKTSSATVTLVDATDTTINEQTYFPMTEAAVIAHNVNLSFLPEGQESSSTDAYYWVAREGKIPMLESFEDLLTNVTY